MGRAKKGVINEARRLMFRQYILNKNYGYYRIENTIHFHMSPDLLDLPPADFKMMNFCVPVNWFKQTSFKQVVDVFNAAIKDKQFISISFS